MDEYGDALVRCECAACTELVEQRHGICEFCLEVCTPARPYHDHRQRAVVFGFNLSLHHMKDQLEELELDPISWMNKLKHHGRVVLDRYLEEKSYNASMFAAWCREDEPEDI